MHAQVFKIIYFFNALAVFLIGMAASAQEHLAINQYLDQVKAKNGLYQGSAEIAEGSLHLAREADLAFTPQFFINAQTGVDSKIPSVPLFVYKEVDSQNYAVGISEQFSFGPELKLSYQADYTNYVDPNITGFDQNFYDVRPVIELSMPLLKNGFGVGPRAQQTVLQAQSQKDSYTNLSQAKQTTVDAENGYWKLSVSRAIVGIQKTALDQSKALYDHVTKQARMNLVDNSDSLQADAAYRSHQVELRRAENDQRTALREFNALRGEQADAAVGDLDPIPDAELQTLSVGDARPGDRADVKAAEANSRLSEANAKIASERNRPSLDVYGSYALNGRSPDAHTAFADSYHADRPTAYVGLKFTVPLLYGVMDEAHRGAEQKAEAASTVYQQRLVDQEKDWRDLVVGLKDAQETYSLSLQVEEAQKRKVENERKLLKVGRSTTFQVLQFEQDYTQSEYYRVQAAYQIITLKNQSKLYSLALGGSK